MRTPEDTLTTHSLGVVIANIGEPLKEFEVIPEPFPVSEPIPILTPEKEKEKERELEPA